MKRDSEHKRIEELYHCRQNSDAPIMRHGRVYYPEQRYNRTITLALVFGLVVGGIVGAALVVLL